MLRLKNVDQEKLGKRRWRAHIELPADWTDVADVTREDNTLVITAANPDVLDELSDALAEAAEEARSIGEQSPMFWEAD
jgi:hypothetical protein